MWKQARFMMFPTLMTRLIHNYMNKKRIIYFLLGALFMFSGDYMINFTESVSPFLVGDFLSTGGWILLFLGIDN